MPTQEDSLKLSNQICFRLYKASRAMIRLYQPILESLKITYPQYVTMLVLWEEEKVDFKELGKRLDLKTGTLTPIIIKLESLGYVFREKNNKDNRKVWVKLTPKGRTLKSKAFKIPELLVQRMDLKLDQYLRYVSILDEINEILSLAEEKQKL